MKKFLSVIFCAVFLLAAVTQAGAQTFTVDSEAELRQAILSANANNAQETDIINITVKEIKLTSPMSIEGNLEVNGAGVTIRGNKVSRLFHISSGTVSFNSVTFTEGGTLSESGGAAYIDSAAAAVNFVNCTFFGNNASVSGAAVYVYGAGSKTTSFTNCTITNNEAFGNGGGVAAAGGVVQFTASIVTGNKAPQYADIYASGSATVLNAAQYNVIGSTNATASFSAALYNDLSVSAADVFKTPAALSNVGGVNVMELSSAVVNKALNKIPAANALSLPGVDQRGMTRPQMSAYDAGAFELGPVALEKVIIHGSSYIEVLTSENYTVLTQLDGAALDKLEWSVDTPTVLSVDANGKVTALAVGTATLNVVAHGWKADGTSTTAKAALVIKVGAEPLTKPTLTVSIANEKLSMNLNEQHTLQLNVTVTPEGTPYTVKFESTHPTIATVTQTTANSTSAVVKASYAGETMISVRVNAANSKGSAPEVSDGYYLTVTNRKSSGGGGGGCQVGFAGAGLLAAAAFILKRRGR